MDVTPEPPGLALPDPETSPDEGGIQIVYAMEVVDPVERHDGARYVRRFTYETREEAWAKYSEAIRSGFDVNVEAVGRIRVLKRTSSHQHLTRSWSSESRSPRDGAGRGRSGQRRTPGDGDSFSLPGSASR